MNLLKSLLKILSSGSSEITLIDVDWDQIKFFEEKPARYLKFKEINHYKKGKRIYVYFSKTVGGGHLGIVEKYRPEKHFENLNIIGYEKRGNKLILIYG